MVVGFGRAYCCMRSAAYETLPFRARKDIKLAMEQDCKSCLLGLFGQSHKIGGCTNQCCFAGAVHCKEQHLALMDKHADDCGVRFTREQQEAFRAIVTENGTVKDVYTAEEMYNWDRNDPSTKPKRDANGRRFV
jgi:hypothetical protein